MSFCWPRQFRRSHPSAQQSSNLPTASISSAAPNNLSISFTAPDNPSVPSAASNDLSVSFALFNNPSVLVNCNTIEPTHHAPGTASLYLPVEHFLTLPGRCAFTQFFCVLSEQQAQTGSTPAHGPLTDLYPDLEGASLSRIDWFSLSPIGDSKRGRDGSRGGRDSS